MATKKKNKKHKKAFYLALYSLSTHTIAGMVAVFSLTAGVVPAWAADSAASGNAAQPPLKASTNPDIVRTLTLLKKQTEEHGTTRIIAGLRIAFVPEGNLTAAAAAQQRNEIARLQMAVLDKVPSLKQRPEQIKRFATTPYMALAVNAAELEALASLDEIASIEADLIAEPTPGIETIKQESK